MSPTWDYDALRNSDGKNYMLDFLPYIETPDGTRAEAVIGYDNGRPYGHGFYYEFFDCESDALERMRFLIEAQCIERIELRKQVLGQGRVTTLIKEWVDT